MKKILSSFDMAKIVYKNMNEDKKYIKKLLELIYLSEKYKKLNKNDYYIDKSLNNLLCKLFFLLYKKAITNEKENYKMLKEKIKEIEKKLEKKEDENFVDFKLFLTIKSLSEDRYIHFFLKDIWENTDFFYDYFLSLFKEEKNYFESYYFLDIDNKKYITNKKSYSRLKYFYKFIVSFSQLILEDNIDLCFKSEDKKLIELFVKNSQIKIYSIEYINSFYIRKEENKENIKILFKDENEFYNNFRLIQNIISAINMLDNKKIT